MLSVKIKMCEVTTGDAFIIKITRGENCVRILVDGGQGDKFSYEKLKEAILSEKNDGKLNAIVITHIDADHIGGILKLLNDEKVLEYICEDILIIFNDFTNPKLISYKQGEQLKERLEKYPKVKLINSYKENQEIVLNNIEIIVQSTETKLYAKNENKIIINMLLPKIDILESLMRKWRSHKRDPKLVNRSSIAFILEAENRAGLFIGDGFYKDVLEVLDKQNYDFKKIRLIKLAHHGKKENNKELGELIDKIGAEEVAFFVQGLDEKAYDDALFRKLAEQKYKFYMSNRIKFKEKLNFIKIEDTEEIIMINDTGMKKSGGEAKGKE